MNTYVPFPDHARSATVLDDRRLGKQRAEIVQILKECAKPAPAEGEPPEHSAVKMWRGYEPFLGEYAMSICFEWMARGNTDATLSKVRGLIRDHFALPQGEKPQPPEWWGGPIHESHQSYLLRALPAWYKQFFPDTKDDLPLVWPRSPEKSRSTAEQREQDKRVKKALKLREKRDAAIKEARSAAIDAGLDPETYEPVDGGEIVEIGTPDPDLLEL